MASSRQETMRPVGGDTKICGIIGYPVAHSLSPRMHAKAYEALGLNWVYVAFPVLPEALPSAVKSIRALGIQGMNVTIPYKEAVIPYLDYIDPVAARMGSVNTIVNSNGQLSGYSTDGDGFILALDMELGCSVDGRSVFIIGAGGSARSIAFSLAENGVKEIIISNRTRYRADVLMHDLMVVYPSLSVRVVPDGSPAMFDGLRSSRIVVNTTPLGMSPNEDATPLTVMDWVTSDHVVCDIIYKPFPTQFLKDASQNGAQILGGSGMLAGQGILAFKRFTGYDVDYSVMRREV